MRAQELQQIIAENEGINVNRVYLKWAESDKVENHPYILTCLIDLNPDILKN